MQPTALPISVKLGLPGGISLATTYTPDNAEADLAFRLHALLVGRVLTKRFPRGGTVRGALTSHRHILDRTRTLIDEAGRSAATPGAGTNAPQLAAAICNTIIEPMLSGFHEDLLGWETTHPELAGQQLALEQTWPRLPDYLTLHENNRPIATAYAVQLAIIAGRPSLIPATEDDLLSLPAQHSTARGSWWEETRARWAGYHCAACRITETTRTAQGATK